MQDAGLLGIDKSVDLGKQSMTVPPEIVEQGGNPAKVVNTD